MVSTAIAPAGGHTDRSAAGSTEPGLNVPSAWHNHADADSAREKTATLRWPDPSASFKGPTTTCTATDPESGSDSGACSVNSSTTGQPTSSPARIASSTKPAPGKTAFPDTE